MVSGGLAVGRRKREPLPSEKTFGSCSCLDAARRLATTDEEPRKSRRSFTKRSQNAHFESRILRIYLASSQPGEPSSRRPHAPTLKGSRTTVYMQEVGVEVEVEVDVIFSQVKPKQVLNKAF